MVFFNSPTNFCIFREGRFIPEELAKLLKMMHWSHEMPELQEASEATQADPPFLSQVGKLSPRTFAPHPAGTRPKILQLSLNFLPSCVEKKRCCACRNCGSEKRENRAKPASLGNGPGPAGAPGEDVSWTQAVSLRLPPGPGSGAIAGGA